MKTLKIAWKILPVLGALAMPFFMISDHPTESILCAFAGGWLLRSAMQEWIESQDLEGEK